MVGLRFFQLLMNMPPWIVLPVLQRQKKDIYSIIMLTKLVPSTHHTFTNNGPPVRWKWLCITCKRGHWVPATLGKNLSMWKATRFEIREKNQSSHPGLSHSGRAGAKIMDSRGLGVRNLWEHMSLSLKMLLQSHSSRVKI